MTLPKMILASRFWLLLLAVAVALSLAACGDDKAKEKEKKGMLKDTNIRTQLGQVSKTLKNLESQIEEQKRRVDNAQKEVEALRKTLESYSPADLAAVDWTTATTVSAAKADKKAKADNRERESATDKVFQTIVILAFVALAIIFFGKLWIDRGNTPASPHSSPEPPAPGPSAAGSSQEKAANGPEDSGDTSPPPSGPPYSM